MKQVDVVWLIEHVVRELDVAAAVSHLARKKYGITIEICSLNGSAEEISATYQPRIVVLPYAYNANAWGIKDFVARWREPIFFNASWEQLFYKVYLRTKAPSDVWSRQHVIHHAWGDFYRDFLVENHVPPTHIVVNGQPAYKLYDEPYRHYFPSRAEIAARYALDPNKRWVFFPENYGWAFWSSDKSELAKKGGMEYSSDEVELMRSFCVKSLNEILQWAKEVGAQGSIEFILRPRPATGAPAFYTFVANAIGNLSPHLHILSKGTVREWIMASDLVMSSYSTSLIEAAIAGKPTYMVEPFPLPDPLFAPWYEQLAQLKSKKDFFDACFGSEVQAPSPALGKWARGELLGHGDPIMNLAEDLFQLSRPGAARPPIPSAEVLPHLHHSTQPNGHHQLQLLARYKVPLRQVKRVLTGRNRTPADAQPDVFDPADVKRRIAGFQRVLA